jgi:hypothetical protein
MSQRAIMQAGARLLWRTGWSSHDGGTRCLLRRRCDSRSASLTAGSWFQQIATEREQIFGRVEIDPHTHGRIQDWAASGGKEPSG